jgi:hypothetical protein
MKVKGGRADSDPGFPRLPLFCSSPTPGQDQAGDGRVVDVGLDPDVGRGLAETGMPLNGTGLGETLLVHK